MTTTRLPRRTRLDRVQLETHPEVADRLLRLDERAPDVMRANQPHFEGDSELFGVAKRAGHAGIGHRNDDVGPLTTKRRLLLGEAPAERFADFVHALAIEARVGAGEVDVLEDAVLRRSGLGEAAAPHAGAVDDEHLAGLDVADVLGADEIERGGLARDDVRVLVARQDAQTKRADAAGIAHDDDRVFVHEEERIGALHAAQRVGDAVFDRDFVALRDEVDEHFGIARRLEDRAGLLELGAELVGVREVAVVADRERAPRVVDREGLGVAQVRAASGRVTDVADGEAAGKLRELLLAEGVLHEAHRAVRRELLAVARDDTGRFLSAVLQRVEPEVRDVGRLGVAVDAEDAAFVVELVTLLFVGVARDERRERARRIENDEVTARHVGPKVVPAAGGRHTRCADEARFTAGTDLSAEKRDLAEAIAVFARASSGRGRAERGPTRPCYLAAPA